MSVITALRETASSLRVEASRLESVAQELESHLSLPESTSPALDPDTDTPPVPMRLDGDRYQTDWVCLMLWAQLRSINVRQGRGATREESVEIAKSAGYYDGRTWNNWRGWHKDDDGGRWVSGEIGMDHLRKYYTKVGRSLPEDLA